MPRCRAGAHYWRGRAGPLELLGHRGQIKFSGFGPVFVSEDVHADVIETYGVLGRNKLRTAVHCAI
jgi:hypothetical protein